MYIISFYFVGQSIQTAPNTAPEAHYKEKLWRTKEGIEITTEPEATAHADKHSRMFKWPMDNFEILRNSKKESLPNKNVAKTDQSRVPTGEGDYEGYEETDLLFKDKNTTNTFSPREVRLNSNQSKSGGNFTATKAPQEIQEIQAKSEQPLIRRTTGVENKINPVGSVLQLPGKTVFQSVKLRDTEYVGDFRDKSPCPFMGIRKVKNKTTQENLSCSEHKPSQEECQKAFEAYELHKKPLTCKQEPKELEKGLCWILDSWRPYPDYKLTVRCEISPCGRNPVHVLGIDPALGTVLQRNKFKFTTARELEEFLLSFIITNTHYGLNFCFLRCMKSADRKYFSQILTFPPILQGSPSKTKNNLFNFNILVLDSVSRAHFYRSLPEAVETLRDIVYNDSVKATAFDFELLQSTAPYTFHNIKVFMSGQSAFDYVEHTNGTYGIWNLYGKLKRQGYYTMLQEDSCWYDEWGSLFTNNVFHKKVPQTKTEFEQRWIHFQSMIKDYSIDDFGLSHSSCEIFKQYKSTNQFNRPRRICYGGTVFAEHFLDYAASIFRGYGDSGKRQPIFSYTHLNLGHEITGTRIRQIDRQLSRYLSAMAQEENTMTLIFSDHGPKTTGYSFETMDGRAEIYDSLLFAIVPERVADILGARRMQALMTNQHRLLSTKELHSSIVSILDPNKEHSHSYPEAGLFAVVPANRTCAEITMKPTAVCKCEGWDKRFPDNHPPFIWLAEFALGFLNNKIQENFKTNTSSKGGYGNCQRLVGSKFEKVRRRLNGANYLVTMDLIVQPRNEIFEVQVTYPINPLGRRDHVRVTSDRRVSIYRRYEKCVDKTVPIDLCVCDSKGHGRKLSKKNPWEWFQMKEGSDVLTSILRMRHFGSETMVKNLHQTCLLLLTRKHDSRTSVAFGIANGCGDRWYKVRLNGKGKGKTVASNQLPISMTVLPRTIHFLFSVYYLDEPYGFFLKTSFVAYISKH